MFKNALFQLIGAVCTYLIILIQFDLAQKAHHQHQHDETKA